MRNRGFKEQRFVVKSSNESHGARAMERGFMTLESITPEDIEFYVDQLENELRKEMGTIQSDEECVIFILDTLNAEGLFRPESSQPITTEVVRRLREATGDRSLVLAKQGDRLSIVRRAVDYDGEERLDTVTDKDDPQVVYAIARIRRAVLEGLKTRLMESETNAPLVHSIDHVMRWVDHSTTYLERAEDGSMVETKEEFEEATISRLDSGEVLKISPEWAREYVADNHEALRHLYALREKGVDSPYISYQLLNRELLVWEQESESLPSEGKSIELQRDLDIVTLDELLSSDNPPELRESIGYWADLMRASDFCLNNGMVLTDLTPDNLRVDTATGRGQAFDLGSLFTRDGKIPGYITKGGYFPPELMRRNGGRFRLGELQSVYELGAHLYAIIDVYDEVSENLPYLQRQAELDEDVQEVERLEMEHRRLEVDLAGMRNLAKRMTKVKPENRPRIDSCLAELYRLGLLETEATQPVQPN